jgi:hypothetical protein
MPAMRQQETFLPQDALDVEMPGMQKAVLG